MVATELLKLAMEIDEEKKSKTAVGGHTIKKSFLKKGKEKDWRKKEVNN